MVNRIGGPIRAAIQALRVPAVISGMLSGSVAST